MATLEQLNDIQEECHLVIFKLNKEEYGIDIMKAKSIVNMTDITRVPYADACIKGIVNLRGSVLPVINLKKRLDMADIQYDQEAIIITVAIANLVVGILVDMVEEVIKIFGDNVESSSNTVKDDVNHYITGIVNINGRIISILNLEKIVDIKAVRQP